LQVTKFYFIDLLLWSLEFSKLIVLSSEDKVLKCKRLTTRRLEKIRTRIGKD